MNGVIGTLVLPTGFGTVQAFALVVVERHSDFVAVAYAQPSGQTTWESGPSPDLALGLLMLELSTLFRIPVVEYKDAPLWAQEAAKHPDFPQLSTLQDMNIENEATIAPFWESEIVRETLERLSNMVAEEKPSKR
jgi:hypothetical protein